MNKLTLVATTIAVTLGISYYFYAARPHVRFVAPPETSITLWTESFGKKDDTPILLLMGAGSSGLSWPEQLCKKLASQGYFVIRFDYRDVGASTSTDFATNPYKLDDLARDATSILDAYGVKKAHFIGLSMGGFIAQILAAQYPERVLTITLIGSTVDHTALTGALSGKDTSHALLPAPSKDTLTALGNIQKMPKKTTEERMQRFLANTRVAYGPVGFNEKEVRTLAKRLDKHTKNPLASQNHMKVNMNAPANTEMARSIAVPVLVLHGDKDAFFPLEHAQFTCKTIPGAQLVIIPGMGHGVSNCFVEPVFKEIKTFLESVNKSGRSMTKLESFDGLWGLGYPVLVEEKLRELLPQAESLQDKAIYLQILTQIALAQALQGKFDEAHSTLDTVQALLTPEYELARVRYLLERGRVYQQAERISEAHDFFVQSFDLSKKNKFDFHTINAAHMIAIVAPKAEEKMRWNQRAIELAEKTSDERARTWLGSLYHNLGQNFLEVQQYEKALCAFKKALEYREKEGYAPNVRVAKWAIAHRSGCSIDLRKL